MIYKRVVGLFIICILLAGCDLSGRKEAKRNDLQNLKEFFSLEDLQIDNTVYVLPDFNFPRVVFFESRLTEESFLKLVQSANLSCSDSGQLNLEEVANIESNSADLSYVKSVQGDFLGEETGEGYSITLKEQYQCGNGWKGKISFNYKDGKLRGILDLME